MKYKLIQMQRKNNKTYTNNKQKMQKNNQIISIEAKLENFKKRTK